MKITFFQKDGTFNEDAIHAGVYIIWVGLTDGKGKDKKDKDKDGGYFPLYVGESYSMAIRCGHHLYEVFHTDPAYFGLTSEHLKNDKLEMIVEIYEPLSNEGMANGERDCKLKKTEKKVIEKKKPLSQSGKSDWLSEERAEKVGKAIEDLLKKYES